MRVIILGFDGLESSICLKYPGILQAEHADVRIDIGLRATVTPPLWTSFITGKYPKEHGVDSINVRKGFKQKIKVPTLFDVIERSIAIQVPVYNSTDIPIAEITDCLGKPAEMRRFAKKRWGIFENRIAQTLRTLDQDLNLLMTHFYITDLIQHLYWYDEEEMKRLYSRVEEVIQSANKRFDGVVIVISDHGQREGKERSPAFYSCSKKLGVVDPHITDFFKIIKDLVKMPDDIHKVQKRLRRLGYVE